MQASENLTGIAIIGMACRFPQAANLDAFWQMLVNGDEATQTFSDAELLAAGVDPALVQHPDYVKKGLVVPDFDQFDAHFFNMNERDAEICDPQRRLFLECAYEALEQAGYPPTTHTLRTGIYAGMGDNHYLEHYLQPRMQALLASVGYYRLGIMNSKDFLATDTAYRLNLKGPAVTLQTACSTSLVAVHAACQSLLNFECDQALAGGVSLALPPKQGYLYQEGMILSPDGHCRAFDADAKGTTIGSGVGIVVLKRLEDALADGDTVHAVIRGSAINNDGSDKIGFTAPSVSGQTDVIVEAQAAADVQAEDISYIEAHGTGTPLGDPIEIQALTQAFRTNTAQNTYCAIGSVKTNIGHTDTAAGIAGLIKTVLALKHNALPPSLHFTQPNPQIDFAHSPFFVNHTLKPWLPTKGKPRCAGISSFGIGGTNAHVILQEAPARASTPADQALYLLSLSAKTAPALAQVCQHLSEYLQQHTTQALADVAYTLHQGRETFAHRRIVVCKDHTDAIQQLQSEAPSSFSHTFTAQKPPRIAFLLPGQGSQYAGMAQDLYAHNHIFRETIDHCASLLQPQLAQDIRDVLFKQHDADAIHQTALTQPALFVVEYALAKLWMAWGIQPVALVGHSIGEYVAACLAGVFSLEEALSLISARGRLVQALPSGTMLAVPLTEAQALTWCNDSISLAVINGPQHCVLAGSPEVMAQLQMALHEQGIESKKLATSHAFHSTMLEPALEAFAHCLQGIRFHVPQIPYLSNLTGDWIKAEQATSPEYWVKHLRHTVRFNDNLTHLFAHDMDIVLEVGPSRILTSLAKRHPAYPPQGVALHSMPAMQQTAPLAETQQLFQTLGQLWLHGCKIDWSTFYAHAPHQRVPLPTYPFQRQRYWLDLPHTNSTTTSSYPLTSTLEPTTPNIAVTPSAITTPDAALTPLQMDIKVIWQESLGKTHFNLQDNFFDLGGDSLMAVHITAKLNKQFHTTFSVNDLLANPTVGALAQLISANALNTNHDSPNTSVAVNTFYPLIPLLQGQAGQTPLFLVHPAGGNLFIYKDLIKRIANDQPIYGFEALGLQEDNKVELSIEDMASSYLDALLRFKPQGDYQLGGASSGGMVAFEMAQQLRKRGKQVTFLGLFDTPMGCDLPMETNNKQSVIEYFASLFTEREFLLQELAKIADIEHKVDWLFAQLKQKQALPDSMAITDWRRLINVFVANINAVLAYKPSLYADQLTFFRAQERRLEYDPQYPELPWLDLAAGGVTVHVVPGDHLSMFAEPHVQQLLTRLSPYLQASK